MHKDSARSLRARQARVTDVTGIATLIGLFTEDGSLLPRSVWDIAGSIDSYVVVTGSDGTVLACAALQEYSPSLAEVGAVAVAGSAQGLGLGSRVVRAVERLARMRGHRELFAITLANHFFTHLGYREVGVVRYPEKMARYALLMERDGYAPSAKHCFRKRLPVAKAKAA